MTAYTKTEARLLSRIASLERAVFDKGPRPDRITELLEANNREVERRRAAEQRVSELAQDVQMLMQERDGLNIAVNALKAEVSALKVDISVLEVNKEGVRKYNVELIEENGRLRRQRGDLPIQRELQAKLEAQEQQNLVLLREIERLQQQVRHSYRGSLFCSSEGTI